MSPVVDRTGQRFGMLLVLSEFGRDNHGHATWLCLCDCGVEKIVRSGALVSGRTVSCGCYRRSLGIGRPIIDRTGQRYGMLVVLQEVGRDNCGQVTWLCLCDCGTETVVASQHLGRGDTVSCGCYHRFMFFGENNPNYKEVVGYQGAHARIKTTRGSASKHVCIDCGQQARHWSYDLSDPEPLIDYRGHVFSLDINRYEPRCARCHIIHDRNLRKL